MPNIQCSLYLSCRHFLVNNVNLRVVNIRMSIFIELKSTKISLTSFLRYIPAVINHGVAQMFKILIVDPNDPFRRSLRNVLVNRFPFLDIQQASDGSKGLEMVQGFSPDLIFLEIHLPSESGLDLARQIRINHPEIIIVMLTSYDLPEYKAAAEASGVEHLVPKDDWTGEDMIALLDTILTDLNVKDESLQDGHQLQRPSY